MFKVFKQKRSWKQEQAEIDKQTEMLFQMNRDIVEKYWAEKENPVTKSH